MNTYDSYSNVKLLAEIENLNTKIKGTGETVFMRMLHELQVQQMELELKNRALRDAQLELEQTRDRYTGLYDFSPLAYFTFDNHGAILEMNLAAANLLGKDRMELIGSSFINYVIKRERSRFLAYLHNSIAGEGQDRIEFELEFPDGKLIRLRTENLISQFDHEKIEACRIAFVEVTEHRIAELKLRLTSTVLENAEEGIMLTDAQKRIVAVNPAFLKMSGYESQEVIGFTPAILKSGHHDEEFYRQMYASFVENDGWQGEIWNRRKNGEIYQEWANIKVIRKSDGEVDCYIGIFFDISNQEKMKHRLKELSYYDELTGLANRSLLYDRLQHELVRSRRSKSMTAVLFLDIDHFADVNDGYGHRVGDRILKEAAERLAYCMREGDTLSRLGGDEFVILLPNIADIDVVAQIATRMVQALEKPFEIDAEYIFISTSVGISISPHDGEEVTVLLKNADTAMYYAKSMGRSNFRYFESSMNRQNV